MEVYQKLKQKRADLWKLFYSGWQNKLADRIPGYTVLLLVPGDLPVFLKIALEVITAQNPDHRLETLVIPDKLPRSFFVYFNKVKDNYPGAHLRLANLTFFEWLINRFNNPFLNCWLQFIRGINASRTTHALWHDADLFITQPRFLKTHYETCVACQFACSGVSGAWDPWFRKNGFGHVTATWELMVDVGWVQSFKPWEHRGHKHEINGQLHSCDITYFPQTQTAPERIGRYEQTMDFVHFNHVIGTYRFFQESRGPYEDEKFRLLLIRLLIRAYDDSGWVYDLPSLDELVQGLTDEHRRVTYVSQETRQTYPLFRQRLQQLIDSGFLDEKKVNILFQGIQPFDKAFGWRS